MIASLRGRLAHKGLTEVVVDVGGVGYRVFVPINALSDLPNAGAEVKLSIYTIVRDDAIHLYGFTNDAQKSVFVTLLGVTGIGPKVALNIISGITHDEFLRAVESEDITRLTRVPGLGKKTAQRIVLELKGKLVASEGEEQVDDMSGDAVSALVNLGYRKNDAIDAVARARKEGHSDIETVLRESLKYLTGER